MSFATTIAQYRERANALWLARTEQERRFLAVGGAVVLLALLYLLLVEPAVERPRPVAPLAAAIAPAGRRAAGHGAGSRQRSRRRPSGHGRAAHARGRQQPA